MTAEGIRAELAELLADAGCRVAVAESCTAGAVAAALSAIEGASTWLRGGVVAYQTEVKVAVLGVTPGPVVNGRAAGEMAEGARRVLGAEVAVATTGVVGPATQESMPVGTAFIAAAAGDHVRSELHRFAGDPEEIRAQVVESALEALAEAVRAHLSVPEPPLPTPPVPDPNRPPGDPDPAPEPDDTPPPVESLTTH